MKAVLFDLDQTLYPESEFVRSGFRAVAAYLVARCGGTVAGWAEEMESVLWREGRRGVFDYLNRTNDWGGRVSVATLVQIYRTHAPSLRLHTDAAELLEALHLPLGLVTDGHATVQHRKVAALGLEARFAAVVCTADIGAHAEKPSEIGYRVCLEQLGVAPQDAAYVGDDAAKDFAAPRALGMRTVRVVRAIESGFGWETPGEPVEADLVVEDLRDAKEFLT
jgi:putative hydrolase of the HAD superfamily